jgi:hypothetical protein
MHAPVRIDSSTHTIECLCGFKTESHKQMDAAWDEYDEHTMER